MLLIVTPLVLLYLLPASYTQDPSLFSFLYKPFWSVRYLHTYLSHQVQQHVGLGLMIWKHFLPFYSTCITKRGKLEKVKKRRWNIQLKNKYKLFSLHMQAILLKSFIGFKFTSLTGGNIHKIRIHTSCIQQNFNLIITA